MCNTKLFLGKNKGLFKLRLVNDKMVVHKVTKNNTNIITFKLLFNFVFNFTNVGPMDELKIVAGKDPTEKQAKNIAAISLE